MFCYIILYLFFALTILIITIKSNILGGHEHQGLMDVVDSTDLMAMGGIRDARHIATQMISVMLEVEPNQRLFDMELFDGASSVQKAGRIIAARFPMVVVAHGADHVGSLFLVQVSKEHQFQLMSKFVQILRNIVDSVHHSEHSMFKECSREHSNGIPLGFVKPSECRMVGEIMLSGSFV
mmetsp:Transcript_1214/g.2749  ORF Transcript_1214/g.2749 Transcript_1214/m.2749 type:complete len:180 (+) Transcript_1214:2050-2589(+)